MAQVGLQGHNQFWEYDFDQDLLKASSPVFAGLRVAGEVHVLGGVGFYAFGEVDARNVIYRGGTDFFICRNFNQTYTILQIWAPPGNLAAEREATLAVVRGNEPDVEYFDFYNNGYAAERQHGIRIQKRGTGAYRDFVIGQYDGTTKKEILIIKAGGNVGINKLDPMTAFAIDGLPSYANNAAAVAAGKTSGDFYCETGTDPLRICAVI